VGWGTGSSGESPTYESFSIAFWWKPTQFHCHATDGNSGCAGIMFPNGDWGGSVGHYYTPNKLGMGHMDASGVKPIEFYLSVNQWYHFTLVAFADRGHGNAQLYLNGGLLEHCHSPSFGPWRMGPSAFVANYHALTKNGNMNAHYGRGDVDEFAAWSRPLSHHEVKLVYESTKNGNHMPV